jgi:hypothetical protein
MIELPAAAVRHGMSKVSRAVGTAVATGTLRVRVDDRHANPHLARARCYSLSGTANRLSPRVAVAVKALHPLAK